MTQATRARSEVPVEHTWDVSSLFANDAEWEEEIARIEAQLPALAAFRGRLHEGPTTVALWMSALEQTVGCAAHVYIYAAMFYNVDTGDQDALAKQSRAFGLYAQALAAAAFAEPELLDIGVETLQRWAREDQRLAVFAHYFDTLAKRQPHIRSAEVEELLSALEEPFQGTSTIHAVLADADLRFAPARSSTGETLEIAQGNINVLLSDADRETRRTAWEHYADAHLALKNTMAASLSTGVKQHVFRARARRYGSSLEAALSENHIPVTVFHSLIETFQKHLPTWHRYWRMRRRALGLEELHVYDIKAPLTNEIVTVPYDTAIEWICNGMQPLGSEYVEVLRRGATEQRWVDIYPNKGKRMGAFSTGTQGMHPFILMNYNDDLVSMSTLAHEFGHSMHSYYTWATQPYIYADYTNFVAEVASNFNQVLVRDYLLKQNQDRDFQIGVLEEAIANFHRYFFIMPTLARFELEIHERAERGQGLTADGMNTLMTELFREGYGSEVVVDNERVGSTWCQFSTHLYSNFYVFQYATGIAAAHALGRGVLEGKPNAVERYLDFLKCGSSRYPIDALHEAGVDMTSPESVEAAFAVLASYVERLEELTASDAA